MGVLGLDDAVVPSTADIELTGEQIEALISQRNEARSARRFDVADQIRAKLDEAGVALEDGPNGTRWLRK